MPGVVDEHVDGAERVLDATHQPRDRIGVGDVGFECDAAAPECANCGGHGLRLVGSAAVVHRHVGAGLGQHQRDRLADTARGAGHQCDASGQIGNERHSGLLRRMARKPPLSRRAGVTCSSSDLQRRCEQLGALFAYTSAVTVVAASAAGVLEVNMHIDLALEYVTRRTPADVPPGANHLSRRTGPLEAAIAPPVMAIPPQLAVVHDRIDDAVCAGERMLDVPPGANHLSHRTGPLEAAIARPSWRFHLSSPLSMTA